MAIISKEQAQKLVSAVQSGQLDEQQTAKAHSLLATWKWGAQNIDSTPIEAKRPTQLVRQGREWVVAEAPAPHPASPEGRAAAANAAGVRTDAGLPFKARLDMAMGMKDQATQQAMILGALQNSGLPNPEELPPGVEPIKMDDSLGQPVVLMKDDETGKFRYTTMDALGFDAGDVADMAVLEEILGTIGGVMGASRGGLKAEFAGEAAGRTIGTGLSALYQMVATDYPVSEDAFKRQMVKNFGEAALAAGLSRGAQGLYNVGRSTAKLMSGKSMADAGFEMSSEEIGEAVARAAADMERLPGLKLTVGEATGDPKRLAEEVARESRAGVKRRQKNEARQRSNKEALVSHMEKPLVDTVPDLDRAADAYRRTAKAVNEDLAAKKAAVGDIVHYEGVHGVTGEPMTTYTLRGAELDAEVPVVHRTLDDGTDVAMIGKTTGVTAELRGSGGALYRQALNDAVSNGRQFASDISVSNDALHVWRSLEREGYHLEVAGQRGLRLDELMDADGKLTLAGESLLLKNADGTAFMNAADPTEPLIRVLSAPAGTVDNYLTSLPARYERSAMEDGFVDLQNNLHAYQAVKEQAIMEHDNLLGWNAQRQISRYKVNNNLSRSKLGGTVRQLEAISQRAIGRGDASEADRLLADLFRDDTGELSSLADPWLDVRQAVITRDRLRAIANKPGGSPLAGQLAADIDSLLRNAKWADRTNSSLNVSDVRAAWVEKDLRVGAASRAADAAGAEVSANIFLREGRDGSFSNTSLKTLERVLQDGNPGVESMTTAIRANPELKSSFQSALVDLWRQKAMPGGTFSTSGHAAFMRNYKGAMEEAFDPRVYRQLQRAPQRLEMVASNYATRMKEIKSELQKAWANDPDNAPLPEKAMSYTNIWSSLKKMGPAQRDRVMRKIETMEGAKGVDAIKQAALHELRDTGRGFVESGNYVGFDKWLGKNSKMMREQFGDTYVRDLEAIGRMMKRFETGVKPVPIENQPLWLRITRSTWGPLSKKQRMATAGNFTAHRVLANNILNTVSDPAKLRQFRLHGGKGGKLSREVVASLTRLGLFDGIPLSEDPVEATAFVNELFADLEATQDTRAPEERSTSPKEVPAPPPPPQPQAKGPAPTPVLPGRGSIQDRRNAAIAASEADLRDYGQ